MNIYKILETLKKVEEGDVIPFNRAGNNPLRDKNDYLDKRDHLYQQLSKNPNLSQIEKDYIKDRIRQLEKAAQLKGFVEEGSKFTFANPKQKPGDQVRGTEKAIPKKSGKHPFKGRLVGGGAAESKEPYCDGCDRLKKDCICDEPTVESLTEEFKKFEKC